MLYERVEERMKEESITEVLVDTPITNTAAIKFLNTLGFGNPVKQVYLSKNLPETETPFVSADPSITVRLMRIEDIWPVYQIGETVFTKDAVNLYRFWDEVNTIIYIVSFFFLKYFLFIHIWLYY